MVRMRSIGLTTISLFIVAGLMGFAKVLPPKEVPSLPPTSAASRKSLTYQKENLGLDDAWAAIREALPRTQADADALSWSEASRLLNGALRPAGLQKMETLTNAYLKQVSFNWSITSGAMKLEYWQRGKKYSNRHWSSDHDTITINPKDIVALTYKSRDWKSTILIGAEFNYGYDSLTFIASDEYIRDVHEQLQNFFYRNHDGQNVWDLDPNDGETDKRYRAVSIPLLGTDGPSLRGIAYLFIKYLRANGAEKDIPVTEEQGS